MRSLICAAFAVLPVLAHADVYRVDIKIGYNDGSTSPIDIPNSQAFRSFFLDSNAVMTFSGPSFAADVATVSNKQGDSILIVGMPLDEIQVSGPTFGIYFQGGNYSATSQAIFDSATYRGFLTGSVNAPGELGIVDTASLVFTDLGSSPGGVPEASTWAMMMSGFGALGFVAYRKRWFLHPAMVGPPPEGGHFWKPPPASAPLPPTTPASYSFAMYRIPSLQTKVV